MKHVLVTGVAGSIGSHLADALLARGDRIAGVDNFNDYYDPARKRANIASALSQGGLNLHELDICDRQSLFEVFEETQPDVVVHLAARAGVRPSLEDPNLYHCVNVIGSQNMLDACREFSPSHLVFASSSSAELRQLFLLALARPKGACILEIGSHLGASALYLGVAAAKRQGRLYCVDTWKNDAMSEGSKDTWRKFQSNTATLSEYITPIRGRSTEFDYSLVEAPLDLVFIDGDHSYDGVKGDFEYLESLFAERPVIAFHDTTGREGVARFLGELLQSGKWTLRGITGSLAWIERADWHAGLDGVVRKRVDGA